MRRTGLKPGQKLDLINASTPLNEEDEEDMAGPETPFDDERTKGEALAERLDGYPLLEEEFSGVKYGQVLCECNVHPCVHNNPRH